MKIFDILKSFNFRVSVLLCVISFSLVLIWLPSGQISAGGDVGIPTLSPQKQLTEVASAWWESHATGITSPITYTAVPFYAVLAVLDAIGLGPDITQKIVFFTILFGGSISIYYLALNFAFSRWLAIIAALFYIFNLTSLSVWQRGVFNGMLMLLLAPLSLLILAWGIKHKRYTSIILINIVTFLISYPLGALGYVFSLWLLWTLYILIVLLDKWQDKSERKFLSSYYIILVISWIGTNSWWIFHLITSSNYVLGQFTTEELKARGSDVLNALKPYHEPSIILRGLSRYYHYVVKDWGDIYLNPLFALLSWIPPLIVFSTSLIKSNYKSTPWRFLIVLTIIVLALSKGVNAPLGDLNKIPFDLFNFLAPLRNTYEKVGILLTIPFSLLFALGINQIYSFLRAKKLAYLNVFIILIAALCLTVLVWPLWLGRLFVSEGRKYAVAIPSYYAEVNAWLKTQISSDDTRILHLPLSWGESIDYDWGYTGIEPSQYFFNGSSIGYHLGIPSVDSRLRDLLINIHNQETVIIQKALASLNVGWIVVHNETLFKDRILEPPERINGWLATKPYFLEYVQNFGPLSIWRVKDQYRAGHFYPAGKLISINKPKALSSLDVWDDIQSLNDGFVTEVQEKQESLLDKFISKNVIFPKGKIKYYPIGSFNAAAALKEIAIVNHLPDSPIYPLITIKEKIISFLNQNDQVRTCFSLSGKRLKEAVLFARQVKTEETKKALDAYKRQLEKCTKINKDTLSIYLNIGFLREEILGQLIRQRAVLENEFNNPEVSNEGFDAKSNLNEYLANLGLSPKFDPQKIESEKQIVVFNYSVLKAGKYNIELRKPDEDLRKNPPKIIQIDDHMLDSPPIEVSENRIRYPAFDFSEGFHEVHLQISLGKNLITDQLEFKKENPDIGFNVEENAETKQLIFTGEAKDKPIDLIFNLENLDIEQNYEVSFDIRLDQGASPILTILHDSDPIDKGGNPKPAVRKDLESVSYPVQWRNIILNYTPVLNSTSAKMAFTLLPWNDCLVNLSLEQCQALGVAYKFARPTVARFKNIMVDKMFDNDLVLEEERDSTSAQKLGTVGLNWKKINPVEYEVNLINQKQPFTLVFSETFHPLWKVTDTLGKEIDLAHFSINGFANGWFVENSLPQNLKIKFVLQNALTTGVIITIISSILSSVLLIYLDYRRKNR